jgi:hypothetical protein
VAAHKFRLLQARIIIRGCAIRFAAEGGPTVIREFINVERGTHQYVNARVISTDEERRRILLERAYADLLAFKKRHEQFVTIFGPAIDMAEAEIRDAIGDDSELAASTQ